MDKEIKNEEKPASEKQKKNFLSFLKDPHKRKLLIRWIIVILIVGLAVLTVVRLCDNSKFVVTFYEIEDKKINNRIRIVQLSDLHLKEYGENNSVLVNEIIRLKPDIIAMTGDMVDMNETDYSVVVELCRQLVNVAPVYFCYGNHEKEVIRVKQTSTVNVDLENLGVHVLHNKYVTVNVNGNLIDIGGLSANPNALDADYTQRFWQRYLQTTNYRLLLVHYPQYFFNDGALLNCDIDMALCGHLHGGIVVIPFIGGLYHSVSGFFPQFTDGVHAVNDTWVVVSRGIGGKIRVNNPPELVVVDIY